MVQIATGQTSGTFKATLANIRATIKAKFTRKSKKTETITLPGGQQALIQAGTGPTGPISIPTATPPSFGGGGGGGSGGGSAPSPGTGKIELPSLPILESSLIFAGASPSVASALTIREQIRRESLAGEKGLSRLAIERRLGGGRGVSALRSGTESLRRADVRISDIVPRTREPILREARVPVDDFGDPSLQTPIPERDRISFGQILFAPFSKESEKFAGIDIIPDIFKKGTAREKLLGLEPDVTFRQLGTFAEQKGGLPGQVFSILLPKTPGEIGLIVGTGAVVPFLPKFGQKIVQAGFFGLGVKTALDPKLSLAERIAGGGIAGGVIVGSVFTTKVQ